MYYEINADNKCKSIVIFNILKSLLLLPVFVPFLSFICRINHISKKNGKRCVARHEMRINAN